MEPGIRAGVKVAIGAYFAGATHPSSEGRRRLASCPCKSVNLPTPLRFDNRGVGNGARGLREGRKMQIIIFSIKFDKLTGFFDKLLKTIFLVNDCNSKVYYENMSAAHSDMAAKKVFRLPRICPQQPAFPPALHQAANPPRSGLALIHQSGSTRAYPRNMSS